MLSLFVERGVGKKKHKMIIEITCLVILAFIIGGLSYLAVVNRATVTKSVEAKEVLANGQQLHENPGCRCNNTQIRYGKILDYSRYESDYLFCINNMTQIDEYAGVYCVTATYKLSKMLNGSWTLTENKVLPESVIRGKINDTIRGFTFDTWNVQSDGLLIAGVFIEKAVLLKAVKGNSTLLDSMLNSEYNKFVNIEWTIPLVTDRMYTSTVFDNNKYLEECQVVGCYIFEPQSYLSIFTALGGNISGYISLIITVATVIYKYFENAHIEELKEKHRTHQITPLEEVFLETNVPSQKVKHVKESIARSNPTTPVKAQSNAPVASTEMVAPQSAPAPVVNTVTIAPQPAQTDVAIEITSPPTAQVFVPSTQIYVPTMQMQMSSPVYDLSFNQTNNPYPTYVG